MCGRFSISASVEELAQEFGLEVPSMYKPRYNAAPMQLLPVIFQESVMEMQMFRWGLLPSWAKDAKIARRLINARGETLLEKPSFRSAAHKRPCLVPADGFYEWQKTEHGKIPHRFTMKEKKIFTFAGLWEKWLSPSNDFVYTFTIITSEPNDLVRTVHDRMGVIVEASERKMWLDTTIPVEKRMKILCPSSSLSMTSCIISSRINSVRCDDASLVAPT